MIIKELIETFSKLPEDMEVMLQLECDDPEILMYGNIMDMSVMQYDDKPEFLALSNIKQD